MRCLMIEPNGKGGIAHYTYNLCHSLYQKGIDVTLITGDDYELAGLDAPFKVLNLFRGTSLTENIWARGMKYVISVFEVLRTIRKHRHSVVHFQWVKIPVFDFLLFLVVRSWRTKMIFTAHNILPHECSFYHRWIYANIYKRFDKVIVHSDNSRQQVVALCSLDSRRVHVVYHGDYLFFAKEFPVTRQEARADLGISTENKVALFFGPTIRYKGLEYLVRAFPKVTDRFPAAKLLIAGRPSPDFRFYEDLIRELGLSESVVMDSRYIPLGQVSKYFAAADTVVTPYTDTYQSGIVQLAYAFSRPVIATTVGGLPDVVEDGGTGYLVPPRDVQALASAIVKLFSDDDRAANMGRRGLELAETRFSWSRIGVETAVVYGES